MPPTENSQYKRVSRLNYSQRCAEASTLQAHLKQGLPLAPGMEIGYVVWDAAKWEVDPERTALKFDASYYRWLLEKAWEEAAFVFTLKELYSKPPFFGVKLTQKYRAI